MALTRNDLKRIHDLRISDIDQSLEDGLRLYAFEWKLGFVVVLFIVAVLLWLIWITTESGVVAVVPAVLAAAVGFISIGFLLFLKRLVGGWMDEAAAMAAKKTDEEFSRYEAALDRL